ncbi:MAG TPA: bifunctional DNA-formamidopyrimidine glycosylase/DNA-(apurinic or apyrimidinic site) lyase [Thermomicrobiales bacterium]|nr:bifunctional DNA-formamidopyrimidine glycosylase/DNA-(apurinic or apyrimidinic site) lyase [Thermomicrobiales bacterium]
MPELPEVETVRRSMAGRVVGATIESVTFRDFPGIVGDLAPEHFSGLVTGETFERIDRRGKHLWLAFQGGNGLFVHLMMTGQLLLLRPGVERARFEHLRMSLSSGWELAYADQRKFGRVLRFTDDEWAAKERLIGPEPLETEFTPELLFQQTRNRTTPIKAFLLDQRRIAGIGNIYADEALYRARIYPGRLTGTLDSSETERLYDAIRTVLAEGIERRGTTLSDYLDADGARGTNAANLRVYGKGGKGICDECGTPLQRAVIAGRGTHFCPNCQPELAGD